MKTEIQTRYTLTEASPDGSIKERTSVSEAKYQSLIEEAGAGGNVEPTAEKVQSFKRIEIQAADWSQFLEEVKTLVPELEEAVNIFNRTLGIKQTDFMRGLMLDPKFQPIDGAYDLSEACAAKTERKSMSPLDKQLKGFEKLSTEDQAEIIKRLQALAVA